MEEGREERRVGIYVVKASCGVSWLSEGTVTESSKKKFSFESMTVRLQLVYRLQSCKVRSALKIRFWFSSGPYMLWLYCGYM